MSSLRDRARQAAREERARAAHAGPTDAQISSAGALSELLDCEVEPVTCEVRWAAGVGAMVTLVTVDDIRFRMVLVGNNLTPIVYEVETGRGALRRWTEFKSLGELDALLD